MLKREETALSKFNVCRTYKKAVELIVDDLKKHGVNSDYTFYISHAFNEDIVEKFDMYIKASCELPRLIEVKASCFSHYCVGYDDT